MNQPQTASIVDYDFLYDYVLVEPTEVQAAPSGLVKPDQYDDKPEFGRVIKVGSGRLMDDGTVVPLRVTEGTTVLFNKYGTSAIREAGHDYLVIREYDIVAVCTK